MYLRLRSNLEANLKKLCGIRGKTVRDATNSRYEFIMSELSRIGIEFENICCLDFFGNTYINIIVKFFGRSSDAIGFVAHYDIANPDSQNCQDNSASVCVLLELCRRLRHIDLDRNIYVIFTDGEEFGGVGADVISKWINSEAVDIRHLINLELVAAGTRYWIDDYRSNASNYVRSIIEGVHLVAAPFNDSYIFRSHDISSVCMGALPNDEMDLVIRTGYCPIWSVCHTADDRLEYARLDDMFVFVELLINLI